MVIIMGSFPILMITFSFNCLKHSFPHDLIMNMGFPYLTTTLLFLLTGDRKVETCAINSSLSALGDVMAALARR